jgi:hypothetical protein
MGTATAEPPTKSPEELEAEQAALDAEDGQARKNGDPPADGQATAKQVDAPPDELLVAGTTQLSLIPGLGGKKPTGSTITLQGLSSIPVMQGQAFEKGRYVRFEGVALIEEGRHKDKVDRKAGVATDSKLAYFAYAMDVRVFPGESPRLPEDAGQAERVAWAVELLSQREPDVARALELLKA